MSMFDNFFAALVDKKTGTLKWCALYSIFVTLYVDSLIAAVYLLASGFSGHWVTWPWLYDANVWQLLTYQISIPLALLLCIGAALGSPLID